MVFGEENIELQSLINISKGNIHDKFLHLVTLQKSRKKCKKKIQLFNSTEKN